MEKKHILVVDYSPTDLQATRELLTAENIAVEICGNGAEARRLIRQQKFDLIISDQDMPLMTGSQLVEWLRTEGGDTTTPFVMLSGKRDPRLFGDLMSRKLITGVFPKPFRHPVLKNIVYTLLGIENDPAFKTGRWRN